MPSRATMITGQHVGHHGVWMNGVPLPEDAPSVAAVLGEAGYRTALIGKAHFEPLLDPFLRFEENRIGFSGKPGPHRGFDHMELATHGAVGFNHYANFVRTEHPEALGGFFQVLDGDLEVSGVGGGDTGAPQVKLNPIPREWYHTDWVADRTIAWLDGLEADADWFCWMSFPDPHHPWDPPESERSRVDWRDLDLPAGYPESQAEREAILDAKPRHWRLWYDGELVGNYEAPAKWVPSTLTADQIREVNALAHVENELIDEAIGRVLAAIAAKGWADDLDVVFTTDHGEFQGDFGLLFKGPYHVDSLMRLPLIWRPAPSAGRRARSGRRRPVGLVDLAPTFCRIAGARRAGVDGRLAAPDRRHRRRRPRLRAGAHRVGQPPARRHRDAPAHHHPRRLGVHHLPPGHGARRHRGRALRPGARPPPAGEPVGRPRPPVDPRRPRRRPRRPPRSRRRRSAAPRPPSEASPAPAHRHRWRRDPVGAGTNAGYLIWAIHAGRPLP